jgi:hypothetical protein
LWEPKIATLVNVHEHGRTLALVAVGDNRIGKEWAYACGWAYDAMTHEHRRPSAKMITLIRREKGPAGVGERCRARGLARIGRHDRAGGP